MVVIVYKIMVNVFYKYKFNNNKIIANYINRGV